MLIFNQDMYDDFANGSHTYLSPPLYNDLIGGVEALLIFVYPTLVTGTSPTLILTLDQSVDSQHWYQLGTPLFNSQALTSNQLLQANFVSAAGSNPAMGSFARIRFSLGGTTPQAQLRITVIGRSA